MARSSLRDFLRALDLMAFHDVLAAEQVDPESLALLTDADLASLGLPLGPRRRILKAAQDAARDPPRATPAEAERRNLTVLISDLVGSTEIASRLDPEDLRALLDPYLAASARAVEARGGFVANTTGDGIVAYFGYPAALEDAAIRAVDAGLDIIEVARRLPGTGDRLQTRVGLATGLAVVTEQPGDVRMREGATGAILSMAARLQVEAPPDSVVIARATRSLLGNQFELRALGQRSLKGFAAPEPVWQVVRGGRSPSRYLALRGAGAREALVGRGAELAELQRHWRATLGGAGSAVLLLGEAGIGKSRLVTALWDDAVPPSERILLQCSPYHQASTLHPVTDWIEGAVGRADEATVEQRLARLAALPGVDPGTLPALARLLGLEAGEEELPADPRQRREVTLAAAAALLGHAPDGAARLLVVEDLHWADASTLEVLERLATCPGARPVMLLFTSRFAPEALGPATRAARCISLDRLSAPEAEALVASQIGAERFAPAVRAAIAERSGGVPLFAEELARTMLEAAADGGPGAAGAVPLTLQDTLMARLDRLPAGKPVAQLASVIGSAFALALLSACADLPRAALDAGVAELVDSGLVEPRPTAEATFVFRHALVRDVAYESILRGRRATLHAAAARAIEERFPALADAQPELVARHWTEAGEHAAAIPRWERAAAQALARSAPVDAIRHLESALDLLARQPASPDRDALEVGLRTQLALPLSASLGFNAERTVANSRRLSGLLELAVPTEAALRVLWGDAMAGLLRGDMVAARASARRLQRVCAGANIPNAWRLPYRMLSYTAVIEGRLRDAYRDQRRALEGYAPDGLDTVLREYPFDGLASGLAFQAITFAMGGRREDMQEAERRCLDRTRGLAHPTTTFQVLLHLAIARLEMGDLARLPPLVEELRQVVGRHQLTSVYAEMWDAWHEARRGDPDTGLRRMRRIAEEAESHTRLWMPTFTTARAELLRTAGRHAEALRELDLAEAEALRYRHRYLQPRLLRLRAETLAAVGADWTRCEPLLREALAVAGDQEACREALLAATALARGLQAGGRADEAEALLAGAADRASACHGLRELVEARAFLERLQHAPAREPRLAAAGGPAQAPEPGAS